MITESQMYWLTRADDLRHVLGQISTVAFKLGTVPFIILFIISIAAAAGDKGAKDAMTSHLLQWAGPALIIISLVALTTKSFMPSTRDYAVIKAIPAILNSDRAEIIQKDASELYDLTVEWAKEQLKGSTNAEQEK